MGAIYPDKISSLTKLPFTAQFSFRKSHFHTTQSKSLASSRSQMYYCELEQDFLWAKTDMVKYWQSYCEELFVVFKEPVYTCLDHYHEALISQSFTTLH